MMENKNLLSTSSNRKTVTLLSECLEKETNNGIMLNLGLVNKPGERVDETPTPTRLIRNCEEVGLFQDLQNVNPFDEFFKKAVENKNFEIPASNATQPTDDSLHTPQIYPQPEEHMDPEPIKRAEKFDLDLNLIDDNDTNESGDALVIIYSEEEDNAESSNLNSHKEIKEKVKTHLIKKTQGLKTVPIQQLQKPNITRTKPRIKSNQDLSKAEFDRREANRWAQARARVRKRKEWDDRNNELKELRLENAKLQKINKFFAERIRLLEAQVASTNGTSNDDEIPLHVIRKPAATAIPVSPSQDITLKTQKATILNTHSEPVHVIQSSSVISSSMPISNKTVGQIAMSPVSRDSNVRILGHTQIVPASNCSNNAVFVIMSPTSKTAPKLNMSSVIFKKESVIIKNNST